MDRDMNITFKVYGRIRDITKSSDVSIAVSENCTLAEAINELIIKYPNLYDLLYHDSKVHSFYTILKNNSEEIDRNELANVDLNDGDLITLLPFIAGG